MEEHSRYNVHPKQSGVKGVVLKNELGLKTQKELDDAETVLLLDSYTYFFTMLEQEKVDFTLSFLFQIHRYFLGTLYSWAGKVRTVDISKGDMLFAPVAHLGTSVELFEKILLKNIPDLTDPKKIIAKKFAIIHNEFIALHPFREGNGRTIRLFLDLLANSLNYHPIIWNKRTHQEYIEACVKGMVQEHDLMASIIYRGLTKKSN